jgi:Arc/MetJ-type ribon-helix-helix transcriptional regulator
VYNHTEKATDPVQRTIEFREDQLRELERLADQERRSLDEVVQLAVGDYLARRRDRDDWAQRLDEVVARFRAGVPPDLTPEEIEAEITANWEEYRAERAAQGTREAPADAGGR